MAAPQEPRLTGGLPLEERHHALIESLHELLLSAHLPPPVISIIADYSKVVTWKLAASGPGLYGPMERLSESVARQKGPNAEAFIQGDTPLSSGVHAWRVTIEGLNETGSIALLGIAQAGKRLMRLCYLDPSLYAVATYSSGWRWTAGEESRDSGLGEIRSGDTLDFLLDVDAGSLTVITLKDGKRCVFALPTNKAWVPHFYAYVDIILSFEVLDPEVAGMS